MQAAIAVLGVLLLLSIADGYDTRRRLEVARGEADRFEGLFLYWRARCWRQGRRHEPAGMADPNARMMKLRAIDGGQP